MSFRKKMTTESTKTEREVAIWLDGDYISSIILHKLKGNFSQINHERTLLPL